MKHYCGESKSLSQPWQCGPFTAKRLEIPKSVSITGGSISERFGLSTIFFYNPSFNHAHFLLLHRIKCSSNNDLLEHFINKGVLCLTNFFLNVLKANKTQLILLSSIKSSNDCLTQPLKELSYSLIFRLLY